VVTAATAFALTRDRSSTGGESELRTFVVKVENFLAQSREGRRDVAAAVGGAYECTLSPKAAALRLNRVQRNRQSLLQQLAAVSVPDNERALRALDLLQKAGHASIAADWRYRDWLRGRARCGPPDREALRAAAHADARATRAKRRFLAAFNPLARRFGQRTWTATEF
jgi:hypothetical protein